MIHAHVEFLGDPGEETFLQALGEPRQRLEIHLRQRAEAGEEITLFIPPPRIVLDYCSGQSAALKLDQVWISRNGHALQGHLLLSSGGVTSCEAQGAEPGMLGSCSETPASLSALTPVLDSEAQEISRRFHLPLAVARKTVLLLLSRLDHVTLRALRIEAVQLGTEQLGTEQLGTGQADVVPERQSVSGQRSVGATAAGRLALDLRQLHLQTQALRYGVDHAGRVVHADLLINAEAEELSDTQTRDRQKQIEGFLRDWPANCLAPFASSPGLVYVSRLDVLAEKNGLTLLCEGRR